MTTDAGASRRGVLERFRHFTAPRQWVVDANDGVIATAGLLEGFVGAGADDRTLMLAASAMIAAGSLGLAGAKWAEESGELDAERRIIEAERAELETDPESELEELAAYWEERGLSPEIARGVAEQLSARDALAAQLAYEHNIDDPTPAWKPAWAGMTSGIAFFMGSMIPLLITVFVPVSYEAWVILLAVLVSLTLTSLLGASTGEVPFFRTLVRTLIVGLGAMGISYFLGQLLF